MEREELIQKIKDRTLTLDECLNLPFQMNKLDLGRVITEMWYGILTEADNCDGDTYQVVAENLEEAWNDN